MRHNFNHGIAFHHVSVLQLTSASDSVAVSELAQFEKKVIPEAQRAEQALKRNVTLDEANTRLSAQVQVSIEKAKRCERSALQWQDQLDNEKAAHRSVSFS